METFQFKVVVAGPFASGKTTFIQHISDIPVVGTEAKTSGHEASVKQTTTVGIEYGTFTVVDEDIEIELQLYGVPGQERFRFMWDIVAEGMDALLVLVDATNPETWDEAGLIARHFRRLADPPLLIGVNRASGPDVAEELQRHVPVPGAAYRTCSVIDPLSARDTLVALLDLFLSTLETDDDQRLAPESA